MLLAIISLLFALAVHAQISTFAGRNTYLGDGGVATSAGLFGPYAIAYDKSGNLYIATSKDNRVRKINATTKIITTIAGTGIAGYSGDNGPATAAELHFNAGGLPGIAVDASGNVYIGDYLNDRVRKITASTGIISTIAGTGVDGYAGDGSAAVACTMSGPAGVALDASGNVYFADNNNSIIREINISTGKISTVAGSYANGGFYSGDGGAATSAGLSYPERFAFDASGNMYIADEQNFVVRKVTASTGIITTLAGTGSQGSANGAAASASFGYIVGITVDGSGNVYVADPTYNELRKIAGGVVSTVAGTGGAAYTGDGSAAASATLNQPSDVLLDGSGNIYIDDNGNNAIRIITASTGIISTVGGDGTNGFTGVQANALKAQLAPQAVALSADGDLLIADGYYYDVRDINTAGTAYIYAGSPNPDPAFASKGAPVSGASVSVALFNAPIGVATDASNNVYIADVFNNVIREINYNAKTVSSFAGTGTAGYSGDGAAATSATLKTPSGVAVDKSGNVYVADAGNNRVRMVAASNKYISTIAGNGTAGYTGDGAAATAAEINNPTAVAVDPTGNVFFIDKGNARVRRVDATTKYISTVLSNGHVLTGIATDSKGNIYVSDSTAFAVLEITPGTFAVATVAGTGSAGYSGDGGASLSAQLNYPGGLSVDASGNVYVADIKNNVIRKFKPASTPAIAGNVISTVDSTVTCDVKISLTTLSGTVPTGGTGSYTYQWKQSPDSVTFTAISGATSQNYTVNAAITAKTFYRRFVTSGTLVDSGNAIGYHPRTTPVPTISLGKGALTFCQGTKDTLTATAGYITYAWSSGASGSQFIDSVSGTYTVTVTDSFGCKGTSAATVTTVNAAPATPTITSSPTTTTNLCPGTTVTLNSSTGTTYKWSTAATTAAISVTAAGTYTDTVYNANGCKAYSAPVTVSYTTAPATPTVTASPATTTNLCPGTTVTLTSSTGTTYKWSTGATTAAISVTAAGTYTDTVYNASGCKAYSAPVTVSYTTAPATPTVTASPAATTNLCPGTTVTLTSSTGATYSWSTGATTAAISVTAAGTYTDTVYNASGCKAYSTPVTVSYTTAPATPTVTASPATTTNLCPGTTVTLTSSTGTTYKWSTGATTPAISVTAAGSYVDTVYNASGCKAYSSPVTVSYTTAPATPTVTSSPATTTNLCPGTTVTLTSSTGTTYKWSTGATTASISVTAAGSYVDTVYNASGCKAYSASKVVSYTTAPATPTITSSPATTTSLCPGTTVTLTSSTGTTYKWSTGATTAAISVTAAGSYVDTVYNSSGCKAYSAAKVVSYVTCATPASPVTSSASATSAVVKWRSVPCAVEYYVQYALSSATTWTAVTITGSTDTTYTISGLTKSTAYKWQVASVCTTSPSVTTSAYTSAVTFTTTASGTVITDGGLSSLFGEEIQTGDKPFDAVVYPNPAISTANLVLTGVSGKVAIVVADLSGKAIWKTESNAVTQVTVPVSNFAAGMYFITVKDEKHIKVLKFFKQ